MRIISYIAIVLTIGNVIAEHERQPRDVLEDMVTGILECARGMLEEGIPDIGFPSLKNFTISSTTFELNDLGPGFEGFLSIEDFEFAGLTDYETKSVSGNIGLLPPSYTVDMQLNFPNPLLTTMYDTVFKSELDDLDFVGTGSVEMSAYNFVTRIRAKITILTGIGLDYFEFWPTLQGLNHFVITGVNHDEDYSAYVSNYIFWNASFIIADLSYRINDIVSSIFMGMAEEGLFEDGRIMNHLFSYCL